MELESAIDIAFVLTIVGLVAGCARMILGPSAADRVVSLDFVTVLLIAVTSLLALQLDNAAYLDLGLALALIGFLATVAFARYVERNPPRSDPRDAGIQSEQDHE
ncbi:MAG: monovalent cation/H+ antiporter complex subunit F [Granulosicoccus sp.]